jgi:hypothetical protein
MKITGLPEGTIIVVKYGETIEVVRVMDGEFEFKEDCLIKIEIKKQEILK